MERTSTRQRALTAALELFSRKGYDGTSMGDIADALGIKAPSLYKHFKGKEEIYAALPPMIDAHYHTLWTDTARRLDQLERDVRVLGVLAVERLEQETLAWFQSELSAPDSRSMRRLLTFGQYDGDGRLDRWLWKEPLELYEGHFERLIAQETLRRGDPHVMAVEFLAPLVQLWAMADRDPAQADACLDEALRHLRQFHRVFAHREPRGSQSGMGRLFRR